MANKKIYSSYLHHQENFRDKWKLFQASEMKFTEKEYVPELTPLFGTNEFDQLSVHKRKKLFFEYIKLVAEALVLFEQILVYGVWHLKKNTAYLDKDVRHSLNHFAMEELYHTHGFRHFLHSNNVFDWENEKIFASSHLFKTAIAFIIKKAPACVFLPGAKLEAFTLSYHRWIKKYYPDNMSNSWINLNHIHQIDESFHVPLEFDLHDSVIEGAGRIRTVLGAICFVILMQIALIQGSYKVIRNVFPEFSFFKRVKWMLKMAKWAVRTSPAYQEARQITKQHFQKKKPKWGKVLSFIYW